MTGSAVTNRGRRNSSTVPAPDAPETTVRRGQRALIWSGWLALILGQALGVLMAYPNLLADRLPFAVDPTAVALAGFGIASLLIGVVAGLALRGASWIA